MYAILVVLLLTASTVVSAELRLKQTVPTELRDRLSHAISTAVTADAARDSARTVLSRHGYLEPTVTTAPDTLIVIAGTRFYLSRIVNDDAPPVPLRPLPFTPENLDLALDRALQPLRDSGYYFARAALDRFTRDSNQVTVHIATTPGPAAFVTDQQLTGLKRTRPDLVRRYLPLRAGDTLTSQAISRAEQAATNIPFVRLTQPPVIIPQTGYAGATVIWSFAERRQTRLEGLVGYAPEASKALVWTADIRLLNPFGAGRDLRITSQRRDRGRDILNIAYAQPVFWLGTGQLSATLATRDYREQFYEFKARTGFGTAVAFATQVGLDLTFRTIEDDITRRSYTSYQAAASLSTADLEQPRNPTSGYALDWSVAYHHRRYDSDSVNSAADIEVLNDTRLTASLDFYQPIVADFVGHLMLAYDGLETSESLPPLSELVFVGGPGSLRGYRTEQFAAIRTTRLTVEPRWRFEQGALFAFYDGAYLSNRSERETDIATEETWRYGYGLGLLLATGTRQVSLSLGWHPGIPIDQPRLAVELSLDI
ncbi:BamA/TamA family outer membrane protein [candidate division GN15 bacterium]|nr:BamA/TamA family outer membrane protein [candidate division GN15 bacterium]